MLLGRAAWRRDPALRGGGAAAQLCGGWRVAGLEAAIEAPSYFT